jgi:membrane-associated phospholipid phosphatase
MLDAIKMGVLQLLGAHGWTTVTLLGNVFVLLPIGACIAALLIAVGRRGEAFAWSVALLSCAAATFALKQVFGDFELTVLDHTFRARGFPSGHVATATAFWGGLAFLVRGRLGALLALPPAMVATAVLVLAWHHTLDLLAAFSVGGAALWLEQKLLRRVTTPRGRDHDPVVESGRA